MDATCARSIAMRAATMAGLRFDGARLLRSGSHVMFLLPDGIVARVGRAGSQERAWRELAVARWLARHDFPAVRPVDVPGTAGPAVVDEHPVTWWQAIPAHRPATLAELGRVLRAFHNLPNPGPDLDLPAFAPFDGLAERIAASHVIDEDERAWLMAHLSALKRRYATSSLADVRRLIHGDAWEGNVAVPESGAPVLLDLEAVCLGPAEWDLTPVAVDFTDFTRITTNDYRSFVNAYGWDVTTSGDFRLLADIQELKWACFAIGLGEHDKSAADEAHMRIACLRGEVERPWTWRAL